MSLPVPTTTATAKSNGGGGGSTGGGGVGGLAPTNVDPRQLADMEAPMIALAQASGGDIRKLLYGFFSFLHRRTDFYVVHPPPSDDPSSSSSVNSMGFKEGDAEKMLLAAFRQFPLRRMVVPPPAQPPAQPQPSNPSNSKSDSRDGATGTTSEGGAAAAAAAASSTTSSSSVVIRYTEEGLQVPVGNGGSGPGYEWTQTIDECTVMIGPLPAHCQRARDLTVELTSTSLSVRPKKNPGTHHPISSSGPDGVLVSGTITERIVPSESTWTIEGGVLVLLLHKAVPTFWKSVLVGHEEIDTTLVDSRRRIDEYDAETQAKLRKIMFDEQQLRRGLPTSDEILGKTPPPSLPAIPTLPPGVEYIDQTVLDQRHTARNELPP